MIIISSVEEYFKKIKKLGEGGFGEVFLVRPKTGLFKGKLMTLKILFSKPRFNIIRFLFPKLCHDDQTKMYDSHMKDSLQERVTMMTFVNQRSHRKDILSYKNIFFDQNTGNYAILMAYVPGMTLENINLRDSAWNKKKKEFLFFMSKNILCTLKYLHKKNVVHRDIKPENIIYNAKTDQITLIDFGLACYIKRSCPENICDYAAGTHSFMHPNIEDNWNQNNIVWENQNWKGNDIYGFVVTILKIASYLHLDENKIPWLKKLEEQVFQEPNSDNIPSTDRLLQNILKAQAHSCSKNGNSI